MKKAATVSLVTVGSTLRFSGGGEMLDVNDADRFVPAVMLGLSSRKIVKARVPE